MNCVIISGVPRVPEEKDPFKTLDRISQTLDLGITKEHVDNCHYLPTRNPNAQLSFIVLFLHKYRKDAVMQKMRADKPTAERFGGSKDVFCQRSTYTKGE